MKRLLFLSAVLIPVSILAAPAKNTSPHPVDIKSPDGTILKGTYSAAAKPGPGVLLYHQSNRTRKSWEDVARQLTAVGINVLTIDADPKKTRKQGGPAILTLHLSFCFRSLV